MVRISQADNNTGKKEIPRLRNTIIIDEIGDPGKSTQNDCTFVISAAITDDPLPFASIGRKFRRALKVQELKAKKTDPKTRDKILRGISDLRPEIHAVYIDKNATDNPEWWNLMRNRSDVYKNIMAELINKIFNETDRDNFTVIIDENRSLTQEDVSEMIERFAKEYGKKIIGIHVERSIDGEHRDLLQANDFIPREVRDCIMTHESAYQMNVDVKRLTKRNIRK